MSICVQHSLVEFFSPKYGATSQFYSVITTRLRNCASTRAQSRDNAATHSITFATEKFHTMADTGKNNVFPLECLVFQ